MHAWGSKSKIARTFCLAGRAAGGALVLSLVCALGPAASRPAQAQAQPATDGPPQQLDEADLARARELGRKGLEALDRGRFEEAETLLSQALALYGAPTLYVARSRARAALGRLIAAASDLYTVTQAPVASEEPAVFAEARATAKRELPALESRFAYVTVRVVGGSAEVTVGGKDWPDDAIGQPRAVNPGSYVVAANAADGAKTTRIELKEGQRLTVTLNVSPTESTAAQAGTRGTRPRPARTGEPPTELPAATPGTEALFDPPAPAPRGGATNAAAFVVGTLTVAATVAAVFTGLTYFSRRSDFDEINRSDAPTEAKEEARDKAATFALLSTALTGASVVGAGVTVYLLLDAGESSGPTQAGIESLGVQLQGVF